MYKELVSKMINRYGRLCAIAPPEDSLTVSVKALINPLLYKNKQFLSDVYLPAGLIDKGMYLYVGEPRVSLENFPVGTTVRCGDDVFAIMRSEQYYVEDTALYTWAVLQLMGRSEEIV